MFDFLNDEVSGVTTILGILRLQCTHFARLMYTFLIHTTFTTSAMRQPSLYHGPQKVLTQILIQILIEVLMHILIQILSHIHISPHSSPHATLIYPKS
jgi:hypothetical protein